MPQEARQCTVAKRGRAMRQQDCTAPVEPGSEREYRGPDCKMMRENDHRFAERLGRCTWLAKFATSKLELPNLETPLGVPSPFFSGFFLSRKPSETQGNSWLLNRTMIGKNGESTPRTPGKTIRDNSKCPFLLLSRITAGCHQADPAAQQAGGSLVRPPYHLSLVGFFCFQNMYIYIHISSDQGDTENLRDTNKNTELHEEKPPCFSSDKDPRRLKSKDHSEAQGTCQAAQRPNIPCACPVAQWPSARLPLVVFVLRCP